MKIRRVLSLAIAIMVLSTFINTISHAQQVDVGASSVKWTGYHLAKSYEHTGYIKVKSGEVTFNEGKLTAGNIVIDMNSISNSDLEDAKDNQKLVNHLKSNQFFNAKDYPEASFSITKVEPMGTNKYNLTAEVTIRGIKQNINFILAQSSANGKVTLQGKLEIDRSKHEVMYGWTIENAIISNNFGLEVKIVIQ